MILGVAQNFRADYKDYWTVYAQAGIIYFDFFDFFIFSSVCYVLFCIFVLLVFVYLSFFFTVVFIDYYQMLSWCGAVESLTKISTKRQNMKKKKKRKEKKRKEDIL